MLKILQARTLQNMNHELPAVQAGFLKRRGTRVQIANICWIIEKAREFQKNSCFCFTENAKAFDCVDQKKLCKIHQGMGISDDLNYLLRYLHAGQEATVTTGHGRRDWLQSRKGVCQGGILWPCLLNLCAGYIMRNAGLDEAQVGSKIARRNISNVWCADDTTLMAESEEEQKGFLMTVKEESEMFGLKLNIQKTKIMASILITLWQTDGETVTDFVLWGSKITADGECSHEVKRCLLLWRKHMTNLVQFCSVSQSCPKTGSVQSLRPHGLQHAGAPCPSPTSRVYLNSCPLIPWCHPTNSPSAIPFSSHLQFFPASGSFQMSQLNKLSEREWKWSRSVMSDSLWPHGLKPTRHLQVWDSPGTNPGVGCHFLFQEIFPTRDWTQVSHIVGRCFTIWATREVPTNLDSLLKSRDIALPTKVPLVIAMVFPIGMYGCESWTIKKASEWMLLNCGIRKDSCELFGHHGDPTIHPKANQSWIFTGRTDAEAPILWPPDRENWHIWKDPDAGTHWRWGRKGTTEDEMDGGHNGRNGHEFE